jgi:hypothetical protein
MAGSAFLFLLFASGASFVRGAFDLHAFARDVARAESVRHVKNVQRQVSHLAQFGEWQRISQLFCSNGTLVWANATAHGSSSIASWLREHAGDMDGIAPGSLSTMVVETPVISLSPDGKRASGRWNGIWFQGDGKGGTRIQGGVYENEYALTDNGWRISLLHYHAMYQGDYENGWRNVDPRGIPIVPYHFTAQGSGVPVPPALGEPMPYNGTVAQLQARVGKLNDEDAVRNLMHARGYYVDQRMWSDVVDLHTQDASVYVGDGAMLRNKTGVRQALERMGPEGLAPGINNDHVLFDVIVEVADNAHEAMFRGIEVAMLGDVKVRVASWEFNVLRGRCVKEHGTWKIQTMETTPLAVSDYRAGWGTNRLQRGNASVPPFLNVPGSPAAAAAAVAAAPASASASAPTRTATRGQDEVAAASLERRLRRSAAYDGAENLSHAYGYYADDILAEPLGDLFAKRGHKASPFVGFFETPARITRAMQASYGTDRPALRSSLFFHWRPQPVILVSQDGRSATMRARLLQPWTSADKAGSFSSAMYHDQVVLEGGRWRLWSVTIDEFYWQSASWKEGWRTAPAAHAGQSNADPPAWTKRYPPDLTLGDVGARESTFRGGSGRLIEWPEKQRMWFQYANPVSGRKPEWYWPGCVPCRVRPDWSLEANGWQEP